MVRGVDEVHVRKKAHIVVDGQMVPWQRAVASNGRRYTPKRTRRYQKKVQQCAMIAGAKPPTRKPVRLDIYVYHEDERGRDWDNCGKTISDALEGIAYENDRQIKRAHLYIEVDRDNPRVEIDVWELLT